MTTTYQGVFRLGSAGKRLSLHLGGSTLDIPRNPVIASVQLTDTEESQLKDSPLSTLPLIDKLKEHLNTPEAKKKLLANNAPVDAVKNYLEQILGGAIDDLQLPSSVNPGESISDAIDRIAKNSSDTEVFASLIELYEDLQSWIGNTQSSWFGRWFRSEPQEPLCVQDSLRTMVLQKFINVMVDRYHKCVINEQWDPDKQGQKSGMLTELKKGNNSLLRNLRTIVSRKPKWAENQGAQLGWLTKMIKDSSQGYDDDGFPYAESLLPPAVTQPHLAPNTQPALFSSAIDVHEGQGAGARKQEPGQAAPNYE